MNLTSGQEIFRYNNLGMKILDIKTTWIHTHFLTDCKKLSLHDEKRIKREMESYLKRMGIVFGIHYRAFRGEKGIRIVLECIPFPEILDKIKNYLQRLIKDVPARPKETKVRIIR